MSIDIFCTQNMSGNMKFCIDIIIGERVRVRMVVRNRQCTLFRGAPVNVVKQTHAIFNDDDRDDDDGL